MPVLNKFGFNAITNNSSGSGGNGSGGNLFVGK